MLLFLFMSNNPQAFFVFFGNTFSLQNLMRDTFDWCIMWGFKNGLLCIFKSNFGLYKDMWIIEYVAVLNVI